MKRRSSHCDDHHDVDHEYHYSPFQCTYSSSTSDSDVEEVKVEVPKPKKRKSNPKRRRRYVEATPTTTTTKKTPVINIVEDHHPPTETVTEGSFQFPLRCLSPMCMQYVAVPYSHFHCQLHMNCCAITGCTGVARTPSPKECFWLQSETRHPSMLFWLFRRCSRYCPPFPAMCSCRMLPMCPIHEMMELQFSLQMRLLYPAGVESNHGYQFAILGVLQQVYTILDDIHLRHLSRAIPEEG